MVELNAHACEKMINDESKSSTRIRATDKAVFNALKKLDRLNNAAKNLDAFDVNVLIYRLVDEYVEDLTVKTLGDEEGKVCVEINGRINPDNISVVEKEFLSENKPLNDTPPELVQKVAAEVMQDIAIKPENPEELALVYIKNLQYFNGAETAKFIPELKTALGNNPYFYLTDEAELADYVLAPKVLKAKVDSLDAGHKRLQMVVAIEISGPEFESVTEYQNRFVLFGAEEDEQQIAARLIRKLLDNARNGVLRRIEQNEQRKFEQKTLGKTIS